jgi:hypothetical protein
MAGDLLLMPMPIHVMGVALSIMLAMCQICLIFGSWLMLPLALRMPLQISQGLWALDLFLWPCQNAVDLCTNASSPLSQIWFLFP